MASRRTGEGRTGRLLSLQPTEPSSCGSSRRIAAASFFPVRSVTTAKWETALGLIEQGKMTPQQFGAMIRTMTAQLVEAIKGVQFDLNRFGVKPSKDTR